MRWYVFAHSRYIFSYVQFLAPIHPTLSWEYTDKGWSREKNSYSKICLITMIHADCFVRVSVCCFRLPRPLDPEEIGTTRSAKIRPTREVERGHRSPVEPEVNIEDRQP